MPDTVSIISKVLPIIILVIFGNVLYRVKFIKEEAMEGIKKLVMDISLPILLFLAYSDIKFQAGYAAVTATAFLACAFMLLLGIGIRHAFRVENRYYPVLFSGFEAGMMGYPFYISAFGMENTYKLAIVDMGQAIFVWFILVTYIIMLNGKSASVKETMAGFFKCPSIIAVIAGIICGSTGIMDAVRQNALSSSFYQAGVQLSSITVPLICILIGYDLKLGVKNMALPLKTAVARLALLLTLAVVINRYIIDGALGLDRTFQIALYTVFILPSSFIIPILIKSSEEDSRQLALKTISINIVLSLIIYPFIVSLV